MIFAGLLLPENAFFIVTAYYWIYIYDFRIDFVPKTESKS